MLRSIKFIQLPFIAVITSLILHAGYVYKNFFNHTDRVAALISGPKTDIGDNYYYFSMLKNAHDIYLAPIINNNDTDLSDYRITNEISKTFAISLFIGELIYKATGLIINKSNYYALLTSIIITAILFISIFQFLRVFLNTEYKNFYLIAITSILGIIFIDYIGLSTYTNDYAWIENLFTYRSNTTRIINPNFFWSISLLACSFIGLWLNKNEMKYYLPAIILAILTGLNSIALSLPILVSIFMVFTASIFKKNGQSLKIFVLLAAITLALLYSYTLFYSYSMTDLGSQLRHGKFLGLRFKTNFFYFLPISIFVYLLGTQRTRLFLTTLFITSIFIGSACDSVDLGSRLWIRGVVIFVWLIILVACSSLVLRINNLNRYYSILCWLKLTSFVCVIALLLFVIREQNIKNTSWNGYIPKDKWNAIQWLNNNTPKNSIIAVSNIEDAYLLPIYTSAKPIYSMYSITNRTIDQESIRFWYNMRLFNRDRSFMDQLLIIKQSDINSYMENVSSNVFEPLDDIKYDAIIFLKLILYYPYTKEYANIYQNSEEFIKFRNSMALMQEKANHSHFEFDYVLLDKKHALPEKFRNWHIYYSNPSYFILKPN